MNKERRERLAKIVTRIEEVQNDLQAIQEEEASAFDDMPEGLQSSDRGQQTEANAAALESACDELTTAVDAIGEALSRCEEVE